MSSSNSGRCEAARFALATHRWSKGETIDEDATSVIDLLTDLRHYCDAVGLDYGDLNRVACGHYHAERSGQF